MNIKSFTPNQALLPYIHAYACVDVDEQIDQNHPLHIFPVEYTVMCFSLNNKKLIRELNTKNDITYPLCYVGFLNRMRSFETFTKKVIQVYFKPFGAFKILGVPQHYFINQATDMESILPGMAEVICKMKDHADDPQKVILILESWLLTLLPDAAKNYVDRIANACNLIQSTAGKISISDLCRQTAMSPTCLRDHFKEKVGFSPKAFSRIVRFNQINNFICSHSEINWADLVYKFEFFDQNHFIKEFKHFFGCTPSQLHKKGIMSFTDQITTDLAL